MTTPTAPAKSSRRHPAMLQLLLRRWHAYIGMVIAPTVLLFSMTGVLQIYELHEAHAGYTPPTVVAKLGVLHKKQLYREGRRPSAAPSQKPSEKPAEKPAAGPSSAGSHPEAETPRISTTLLKAFFALASVGLVISTITGVWMTLRQPLNRVRHILLLAAGAVIPLVLACLSQ